MPTWESDTIYSEEEWRRYTDPATAPSIPMQTNINTSRETFDFDNDLTGVRELIVSNKVGWKISTSAWIRETNKIHTFVFSYGQRDEMPSAMLHVTDPTPGDLLWLKNIGARP